MACSFRCCLMSSVRRWGVSVQQLLCLNTIMVATDWSGLEIRHLAALQAVADSGNFSRAADRLGYTQSAVSQQVAALERIVGVALFERPGGPRPVTLTPSGEVLRS